ncbi:MAG: methyltransferase [Acidimicrobiales bacterium]
MIDNRVLDSATRDRSGCWSRGSTKRRGWPVTRHHSRAGRSWRGSGAIGLSLAVETKGSEVWITDITDEAVSVIRANLIGIGRPATSVRVVQGSWFDALPVELAGTLAVVVSNPPYVADDETLPPLVDQWEPRTALRSGPTGLEDLELIVDQAPRWLRRDGALVLEMAPHQTEAIADRAATYFAEVEIHNDLTGRARAVVARHRDTAWG